MGRPPSDLEDYREWQRRLERYQTSDVNLDVFASRRVFLGPPFTAGSGGFATAFLSHRKRTLRCRSGQSRMGHCSCPYH